MKEIGFIGLGVMGRPMSRNLIKSGYTVRVYGRTRSKLEEMLSYGAIAAESPRELARNSHVIITMVPDSKDVKQVILGASGAIEGAKGGSVVIDMSTISPQVEREIAIELHKKDVEMLDAPVSGGDIGAIQGTLTIMVGGERRVFEECLPILQAMGKNIVYMGGIGSGQTAKMCNQILVSLNLLATCEALIFGKKAGLDMEKTLQAISGGAAGSWQLSNLGPKILKRDFEPGFKVEHIQKDLRIALSIADDLKLPLPGTSLVHELFHGVEADGMGKKGTQVLIHALEKLASFQV